jgi:hypothetical protein
VSQLSTALNGIGAFSFSSFKSLCNCVGPLSDSERSIRTTACPKLFNHNSLNNGNVMNELSPDSYRCFLEHNLGAIPFVYLLIFPVVVEKGFVTF